MITRRRLAYNNSAKADAAFCFCCRLSNATLRSRTLDAFVNVEINQGFHKHISSKRAYALLNTVEEVRELCQCWKGDFNTCQFRLAKKKQVFCFLTSQCCQMFGGKPVALRRKVCCRQDVDFFSLLDHMLKRNPELAVDLTGLNIVVSERHCVRKLRCDTATAASALTETRNHQTEKESEHYGRITLTCYQDRVRRC